MSVSVSGGGGVAPRREYVGSAQTSSTTDVTMLSLSGAGKLKALVQGANTSLTLIVDGSTFYQTTSNSSTYWILPINTNSNSLTSGTTYNGAANSINEASMEISFQSSIVIKAHVSTGTQIVEWKYSQ